MKPLAPHPSSRGASRGVSLIELLVSIAIGLILMVAILSSYVGSSQATRAAEAQGRMHEDAQAALSLLSQQLRMAGYNPRQPSFGTATPRNPVFAATDYAIRGCDGTFSNITSAANIPALTCAGAGADSFAVRYEADAANTVRSGTGLPTDCLGQTLTTQTASVSAWNAGTSSLQPTSTTFWIAENRFYVGTATAVVNPSLYCKGSGGANAQPLVENIEDMQVVYGTAPHNATSTLSVAGYITAAEMTTAGSLPSLPDDPTRWSRVATARICILVRSEQPAAPDAASAQYIRCDGTVDTSPPDLRLRRAYTTTVVLRNRLTP
jgi:type IV pilus assembly protein PilW